MIETLLGGLLGGVARDAKLAASLPDGDLVAKDKSA
jgi:hypothetical protein